jgi:flagellar hook-basal body complex protein FliE
MAEPIAPIDPVIRPIPPVGQAPAGGPGFAEALRTAVAEVEASQRAADSAARDFATGRTTDVAATMIAVERAAVTFQLVLQVRNRLLEAYQDIQRIQV